MILSESVSFHAAGSCLPESITGLARSFPSGQLIDQTPRFVWTEQADFPISPLISVFLSLPSLPWNSIDTPLPAHDKDALP
jgi:hypothetical protein